MNLPQTLKFTITFHGPFHVGGSPFEGLDRTLDRDVPLPSTSLKGLLRAEAVERLGIGPSLVGAVFGSPAQKGDPGAWWWSDAEFAAPPVFSRSARIKIDNSTGTTEEGFLMLGEDVWADSASFTVEPLNLSAQQAHEIVLRAAARSVSSLGGDRRRGSGWVSIRDDLTWSEADTAKLLQMRGA